MAIPLIVPLLFTGASMAANAMAARRQDNARADALAAERIRQGALDKEAFGLVDNSRDQYASAPRKQDQRSDELAQHFKDVSAQPAAVAAPTTPTSGNVVVQGRNERAAEEGRQFTDARAENLADFRSFGDLFGDFGRQTARDAAQIGTIGGFKRGSSGILPMELEAANQQGQGMRTMADLFSLGSAMTAYPALTGGNLGFGNLFGGAAGGAGRMASPPPRRPF